MADAAPQRQSTRRQLAGHLLLAALVGLVAGGLRVHRIGEESLWIDEAITYARASYAPDKLVADSLERKHVPTYFLLMHHYMPLGGDSEAALRMPSAFFGAATASVCYGAGAVLGGPVAGLGAGLLVATARSQLRYGQEARMYTLLTFFAALAMWGLALLGRGRSPTPTPAPARRRASLAAWGLVALGTVGALYTHNTAIFFVASTQCAALATCLLLVRPRARFARAWLACQALCLLLWAPWLPKLLQQSGTFDRWAQATLTWKAIGSRLTHVMTLDQGSGPLLWLLLAAAGCALLLRRPGRVAVGGEPDGARRQAVVLLLWALAGPCLCAAVSLGWKNVYFVRTLLWAALPFFLLVGVGLSRLPRSSGLVCLALILALNAPTVAAYYGEKNRPPWRALLQQAGDGCQGRCRIVSTSAHRFVRYYYNRRDAPLPRRPVTHYKRKKSLRQVVGDAPEFWWLAWRGSDRTRRFERLLRASPQYERVFYRRRGSAQLAQYRLRAAPPSAAR